MSSKPLFRVGEMLTWDPGPYEADTLRWMINHGEAPAHPVVVEVKEYDATSQCPICGSTETIVGHRSWRIDEINNGICPWGGEFPHPQWLQLQVGQYWWSGDWFKKL